MSPFIITLFDWMPSLLFLLCTAVVFLFFFVSFLHIINFIMDIVLFFK